MQGLSAAESGIKFIPLAFPEVVAIILVGVVVNRYGHYVSLAADQAFPNHEA